jgi:hypothetical protein
MFSSVTPLSLPIELVLLSQELILYMFFHKTSVNMYALSTAITNHNPASSVREKINV